MFSDVIGNSLLTIVILCLLLLLSRFISSLSPDLLFYLVISLAILCLLLAGDAYQNQSLTQAKLFLIAAPIVYFAGLVLLVGVDSRQFKQFVVVYHRRDDWTVAVLFSVFLMGVCVWVRCKEQNLSDPFFRVILAIIAFITALTFIFDLQWQFNWECLAPRR